MAEYRELKNSFNQKLKEMVNGLTTEELFWALNALELEDPQALVNNIAEKLMAGDLNNDELLTIALSSSHFRKDAAKKILARDPSNAHLALIEREPDLLGRRIANKAKEISDNRLFAETTIREDLKEGEEACRKFDLLISGQKVESQDN